VTAKPLLPDDYELPDEVNGWTHDPDSGKNGHTWYAPDRSAAVGVFGFGGTIAVKALDERVSGFARSNRVFETEYEHTKDYYEPADPEAPTRAVVEGVDAAVRWMERTDTDWRHPAVEESAFDPPDGFVLDRYYLEEREQIICYRQEGTESEIEMSGWRLETEPSLETRKYLYVEAWRGSGNATIALAPWLRAHDHEKHEVVDPPEECGIDVALLLAREYVAEQVGDEADVTAGQAPLDAFAGGGK
jgi:hypothetical protein